jgi:NADPH-dependent F420 reductase
MKIGVIGTGNMGDGLGRLWASRGHKVTFGSRNPENVRTMAGFTSNINSSSIREAASFGEVILLAVPWSGVENALKLAGPLSGKILVDCTNPLTENFMDLVVGFNTSAAEEIAKMAPDARVVKAFNAVSSATLSKPVFNSIPSTVFYCGDDPEAKRVVAKLITDLAFEPVDAGPLRNARYLEPLAELFIQLAYTQGMGPEMAFKLLRK